MGIVWLLWGLCGCYGDCVVVMGTVVMYVMGTVYVIGTGFMGIVVLWGLWFECYGDWLWGLRLLWGCYCFKLTMNCESDNSVFMFI